MESERTTRLISISREAYRRMAENTNPSDRAVLLEAYRAASKRTQSATDLDYALECLENRAASVAQLRRRLHAATMRHADRGEEKTYNAKNRLARELEHAIYLLSRAAYGLVKAEESDRLLYGADLEYTPPVEQAPAPLDIAPPTLESIYLETIKETGSLSAAWTATMQAADARNAGRDPSVAYLETIAAGKYIREQYPLEMQAAYQNDRKESAMLADEQAN